MQNRISDKVLDLKDSFVTNQDVTQLQDSTPRKELVTRQVLHSSEVLNISDMMVYPDLQSQWPQCTATTTPLPMLQLYDDVGYRGKY